MQTTKIVAGRYSVEAQAGSFTIKRVGSKKWVALNHNGRPCYAAETKSACEAWVTSLEHRPASEKSTKYLRHLLTVNAGSDLAELIRGYLSAEWNALGMNRQSTVARGIKALTGQKRSMPLPRQYKPLSPAGVRAREMAKLAARSR